MRARFPPSFEPRVVTELWYALRLFRHITPSLDLSNCYSGVNNQLYCNHDRGTLPIIGRSLRGDSVALPHSTTTTSSTSTSTSSTTGSIATHCCRLSAGTGHRPDLGLSVVVSTVPAPVKVSQIILRCVKVHLQLFVSLSCFFFSFFIRFLPYFRIYLLSLLLSLLPSPFSFVILFFLSSLLVYFVHFILSLHPSFSVPVLIFLCFYPHSFLPFCLFLFSFFTTFSFVFYFYSLLSSFPPFRPTFIVFSFTLSLQTSR
jgi:hypothetical protein